MTLMASEIVMLILGKRSEAHRFRSLEKPPVEAVSEVLFSWAAGPYIVLIMSVKSQLCKQPCPEGGAQSKR
jgi:hypothetical protein